MRMLLLLTVFLSSIAMASVQAESCLQNPHISGGDTRPWPWGSEIRFPWTRIQGVWAPVESGCDSYFLFKVTKQTSAGDRIIQVTQYDPFTCAKLASGLGFETNKIISASMVSESGAFDLTIRAFDNSILKRMDESWSNQLSQPPGYFASPSSVVVLSIYPKKKWELRKSYQIQKVQSSPVLSCE